MHRIKRFKRYIQKITNGNIRFNMILNKKLNVICVYIFIYLKEFHGDFLIWKTVLDCTCCISNANTTLMIKQQRY